jgi:hypothetical protein
MVERSQGNLLAVGLPRIDSEILPRRNRAFSLSARLLECVAFQTHHQTQVSSVEQPWMTTAIEPMRRIRKGQFWLGCLGAQGRVAPASATRSLVSDACKLWQNSFARGQNLQQIP